MVVGVETIPTYLSFGLFGTVALWLVLCEVLHSRLKKYDPDIFVAIGEPHIITNNTLQNLGLFLRLLFSSSYSITNPTSRRLVVFMRWYLIVYTIGFITFVALVFGMRAAA